MKTAKFIFMVVVSCLCGYLVSFSTATNHYPLWVSGIAMFLLGRNQDFFMKN